MGVLRWGSEYLIYIIHFFDIGNSAMGWSGEPSGQAGQKNMAVIAVLLCRYDIGDLLFGCYRWFYYRFISSGGLEKQMEQFLLESK